MQNQDYNGLTTKDLIKKKNALSTIAGALTGALIVLLVISILTTIKKGFTPLVIVPLALLPILIINYNQISTINKELKNRQSN
jgi:hypothetical protein